MKLVFAILILISSNAWANTCALTADGRAYEKLELTSCGDDMCVLAKKPGETEKTERLVARGCTSLVCSLQSKNFVFTIPQFSNFASSYLGEKNTGKILISCPP